MELSNDLVSQFVKITKDVSENKTETIVYGTIKDNGGVIFVQLDGSELYTPTSSTVSVKDGDRVTAMIKDHSVIITGNLTDKSASSKVLDDLSDEVETSISELDDSINLKVSKGNVISEINLSTEEAKISANKINIEGAVSFSSFDTNLQTNYNSISDNASNAISTANDASENASAALTATNSITNNIYTRNTTTIDGGKITTGSIDAEKINVNDLFAQNITATGNINFSNDGYLLSSYTDVSIKTTNINTYFRVTNDSYYFAGNGSTFTSNNYHVNNSTAETELYALYDMNVRFNYSYSTEEDYDYFYIRVNGGQIIKASGYGYNKSISISLKEGYRLSFRYVKDKSNHMLNDVCSFSNMVVSVLGDGDNVRLEAKNGTASITSNDELYLNGVNNMYMSSESGAMYLTATSGIILNGGSNGIFIDPSSIFDDMSGGNYRVLCTKDIDYGEATASYNNATNTVTVYFSREFNTKPKVFVSQVFDNTNIVVKKADIYTDRFIASIPPVSSTSSGTRVFSWLAIGK